MSVSSVASSPVSELSQGDVFFTNTEYPSSPIDFNNNTTTNSYSKSFSPMGSGSIPQLGSPSMAQNLNPPLNSIALSLLRNVTGGSETSPIDLRFSRHSKLDRSMSEPIDPNSFQMAPRSQSFSSGNTNNNNDDNKSVSISSRYKTELCRTYEERGTCKYGDKCQFAHGFREMRDLTRHPKYKTELCRTFHSTGFCPYGTRCHFIHNDEESRKPRSKSYSLDGSGDLSPDLSSPSQSLSFFSEELSPNSSFQQSPSPPFNISTLSESFTFPHHDYQQKKIEQRNSFNGLTKSAYEATIAALLAQQPMGKLYRNIDDDVFQRAGLVSPVSDDHLADLSEKVKLLTLAVRLQQEGKFNNLAGTSLTEIKNFF